MKAAHDQQPAPFTDFERITRVLRWFAIAAVVVTFFPDNQSRLVVGYGFIAAAVLFNITRYSAALLRWRAYASPITVVALDGIFIGGFIALVGAVDTPYTGFLTFLIVTSAYKFGLRGVLVVAAAAAAWLSLVAWQPFLAPMPMSSAQTIIIITFVLSALGVFMERLTRSDRQQRDAFKKLNQESAAERSRLLALVNSINDAVYVVDSGGRIIQHNESAAALVSETDDLSGTDFKKALPLRTRLEPDAPPLDILKNNADSQHRRDLIFKAENGVNYDLEIQITPISLDRKSSSDYIVVARDITKERNLDEQRKEFVSVASHELRTPLAIMEGALSSVLEIGKKDLPEPTRKLLEQAHRNSLQLGGIVKDLGMLGEAQNDNLPIELSHVYPKSLLDQLVGDFSPQAGQQGLSIKAVTARDTPKVLSTERHIKEILQNYLSNALKYTKEGGVQIEARPSRDGGVLFSVTDNGIGISPQDQKRLFTKFFRAEDYRTRETGGTGLGLYLCQELAGRINAKVWCESKLNRGSTFYLEVPPFSQLQRDHGEVTKAQVSSLVDEL